MTGRSTVLAGLLATAMVATACGPSDSELPQSADAPLPFAPDVRDLRSTEPVEIGDGFIHVIVKAPAVAPTDQNRALDPQLTSAVTAGTDDGDQPLLLTPEMFADAPPDAVLEVEDGVIGYRDTDGTFTPLPIASESALDDPASSAESERGDAAERSETSEGVHDDSQLSTILRETPGVVSVSPIDGVFYAVAASSLAGLEALDLEISEDAGFALTADPYEPYQWAMDNRGDNLSSLLGTTIPDQVTDADVDGAEARSGPTGAGVVVAIVDSGIDFSHPDLDGSAWVNPGEDCDGSPNGLDDDGNGFVDDCNGWDFGDGDAVTFDGTNDDHGTHVAGVIAARTDNGVGVAGVAPGAEIMDLKVSHRSGAISSSSIARAIRYAVDHGADVINLSLGSSPGIPLAAVLPIADAVDHAGAHGVVVVAAAGNNGISLDDAPVYPASLDADHMLVVAASTPADSRASFSNVGTAVDLFAPGELVLSTVPGGELAFMSGTSQAAPIVAGTVALYLEQNPDADPAAAIAGLVSAADDLGPIAGPSTVPFRLNTARTVGIEPDRSSDDDLGTSTGAVTIRGLGDSAGGVVEATISIDEVGGQFHQKFDWEVTLVALIDGLPFAVIDHPVDVGDPDRGVLSETATNGRGAVVLGDEGVRTATWTTDLPNGTYALVVEAIPRTDSTVRLGDAHLVTFGVGPSDDRDQAADDSAVGGPTDGGPGGEPGDAGPSEPPISGEPSAPDQPAESTPNAEGAVKSEDGGSDIDSPSGNDGQDAPPPSTSTPGVDSNPADSTSGGDDDPAASGRSRDETTTGTDPTGTDPTGTDSAGTDSTGPDSTGPGPDPIELGPDSGSDGVWSVTGITPRTGPINSENLVELTGSFPSNTSIWFGDSPGRVVFQSERLVLVRTRRYATAEIVDVSVHSDGEVLRLADAYAFVEPGDDRTVVVVDDGGGDAPVGDDPADSLPDPGFGDAPGGLNPVPSNPVPTTPMPADSPAPDPPGSKSRNRQARSQLAGDPVTLPDGLTGIPLSGLDTVGDVPACHQATCRARRIGG